MSRIVYDDKKSSVLTSEVELSRLIRERTSENRHSTVSEDVQISHDRPYGGGLLGTGLSSSNDDLTEISRSLRVKHPSGKFSTVLDGERKSSYRGWRKSVLAAAATTSVVLIINTTLASIATTKIDGKGSIGVLFKGDCYTVRRWNTALHLFINLLGTFLLGASSFTMQCLSSPTRSEVNTAHGSHTSLDIGIASIRNLKHLHWTKGLLWSLLCLTTLPLHLLWNSAVFSTDGSNIFDYVIVREDFLTSATYEIPDVYCDEFFSSDNIMRMVSRLRSGYSTGNYTTLNLAKCLEEYGQQFLPSHRDLIMVTTASPFGLNVTGCHRYVGTPWNGSSVLGVRPHNYPDSVWTRDMLVEDVDYYDVKYCLSETKNVGNCELQFVLPFLWLIVACNAVKLFCMTITIYKVWDLDEPILATVGDAVISFLTRPDASTAGYCLIDRAALRKGVWRRAATSAETIRDTVPAYQQGQDSTFTDCQLYKRKPSTRLFAATTPRRYHISMSYTFASFGSGTTESRLDIDGSSVHGLINSALVANSFQLALSTTYFLYNSLFTAQCAAREWTTYISGSPKPLHVTYPHGNQRSTYYLQLPWRYGIPLTICLIIMHFLISQSIFLARLQWYDFAGTTVAGNGYLDVGFSGSAILASCCVGAVMILAQFVNARRKLDNRIPIHGNSSAVISAMCHLKRRVGCEDQDRYFANQIEDITTRPLMWGVTQQPEGDQSTRGRPGHCTFTDEIVDLPVLGKRYC